MQRLREAGNGQGTVSRMSSWISDLVTLWLLAQGEPSWIPDLQDCEMIVWAVLSHQVMVICCSRTGNWDAALEKSKGTCGRAARETGNPDPGAAAFVLIIQEECDTESRRSFYTMKMHLKKEMLLSLGQQGWWWEEDHSRWSPCEKANDDIVNSLMRKHTDSPEERELFFERNTFPPQDNRYVTHAL